MLEFWVRSIQLGLKQRNLPISGFLDKDPPSIATHLKLSKFWIC